MAASKKTNSPVSHLPLDIVGGSVPYDPGRQEQDIIKAASMALGTERIVFHYSVFDNRCWYLAIPSSELADNPYAWCPLANALPGGDAFIDKDHCYIYEQDDVAAALSWNRSNGRMEVFAGAAKMVLPKLKTLQKPMKHLKADELSPIIWFNHRLNQEKQSKRTASLFLMSGLCLLILSFAYGIFIHTKFLFENEALGREKQETVSQSVHLIEKTKSLYKKSPEFYFFEYFSLQEKVQALGGELESYKIGNDGKARIFKARIPRGADLSDFESFDFEIVPFDSTTDRVMGWIDHG